jgi:hypothetical protein
MPAAEVLTYALIYESVNTTRLVLIVRNLNKSVRSTGSGRGSSISCPATGWLGNSAAASWSHSRVNGRGNAVSEFVFAAKHFIGYDRRPALIQGKEGYDFFSLDQEIVDGDCAGKENEFFDRGTVRDEKRYYERVGELGRYLYQLVQQYDAGGRALDPKVSDTERASVPVAQVTVVSEVKSPDIADAVKHTRVIYVAQPAADMRQAYDRVVAELQKRGFAVVPEPGQDIPNDDEAVDFIDAALAKADLSVHLLGERLGYAPEDAEPILRLQLAGAAAQIAVPRIAPRSGAFFRLIWAPRVLAADEVSKTELRDPLAVLAKFDRQRDTNKIEGENLRRYPAWRATPPTGIVCSSCARSRILSSWLRRDGGERARLRVNGLRLWSCYTPTFREEIMTSARMPRGSRRTDTRDT